MVLGIETVPARGVTRMLVAKWANGRRPARQMVERRIGDSLLLVDKRVARYSDWQTVAISAWRLGPLDILTVVDEPLVMLRLPRWERLHPGIALRPAA